MNPPHRFFLGFFTCVFSDLSARVDAVKEENLKLKSENQVLGQYIENLMSASSVFQATDTKGKRKWGTHKRNLKFWVSSWEKKPTVETSGEGFVFSADLWLFSVTVCLSESKLIKSINWLCHPFVVWEIDTFNVSLAQLCLAAASFSHYR